MTKRFFVDTNVLVYSLDSTEPEKQRQARRWIEMLWKLRCGRISAQVLAEFYEVVTRRLKPGLSRREAREITLSYSAWEPVPTTHKLLAVAFPVQEKWGFSWWDSLIVAAAKVAECSYFLSEDLQDRQELGGLRVVNPMKVSPEETPGTLLK